jgi:CPA2 family monovalent cation:H+ antiporter-2
VDATRLIELGGVILGLALLARLAGRFGLSAIPLYLLAGLAFGRGGVLPLVTTEAFVSTGSEIGLILLLFMLDLEYSATELVSSMRSSLRAGFLDVALNYTPGLVAELLLGWGLVPSMFLGGVTLVTSSSIAAKILTDLRWTGNREATFVLSMTIIEDLSMALYLPVLGALVVGGPTLAGLGTALAAVLSVVVILGLALRVEIGLSRIIFSHSDEALLLTILGLAVLVAGLAELVQISAAVGALVLGIVLSGPAAHGARQLLTPLRDLFAALFFAFIGLGVDPSSLTSVAPVAGALAAVGTATKFATGWLGSGWASMDRGARARAGALLIPRGEFSIAIAGLGVAAGLDARLASVTVAYVLLLAMAAPILARAAARVGAMA